MRILVTGGVRSGKSRHAEGLLREQPRVTYVAPGPTPQKDSDPDWMARIEAHRAHRPTHWETLETHDLPNALEANGAVLVDCLGTWLTSNLDEQGLWDASSDEVADWVRTAVSEFTAVLSGRDDVVFVTNEVGLGVVPEHRSGRLFRDLLGVVNQLVADECDEVHLVISGRVLVL
jgi:adenosylcobinamide kinase/adenosylcobinamide-phosphate guanylyltransferase